MATQEKPIGHYDVELTDTFGGEANYSWVVRKALPITDNMSDLALVRRAKKVLGINGLRCSVENYGDVIQLKPYRALVVAFISYCDSEECNFLHSIDNG